MTSSEKEEKWTKDTVSLESHDMRVGGGRAECGMERRVCPVQEGLLVAEGTAQREEEEGRTAGQGPVQVQTACGGVGRGASRSGDRRV